MILAKLREMISVAGMNAKEQEILLNPHSVVSCRPRLGGGSLITLSTGKEIEVAESPKQVNSILLTALKG
jgi:uncharacterized protein YlzI (FlbEa/FlbD family)